MRNIRTDKISHGYLQVYDPLFMSLESISNVLEIGVYNGDSLRLLQSYFPNSNIYGFDLTPPRDHHYNDRFKVLLGNQEDRDDLNGILNNIDGDLDLIIDDGGHTMKQQQISFGCLFRHLKKGGVYIIEDIETSYWGRSSIYGYKFNSNKVNTVNVLLNAINYINSKFLISSTRIKNSLYHDIFNSVESLTFGHNCIVLIKKDYASFSEFYDGKYILKQHINDRSIYKSIKSRLKGYLNLLKHYFKRVIKVALR